MDRTVRIARIPKVAIQNRKKERENKERTIEGKKEKQNEKRKKVGKINKEKEREK